MATNRDYDPSTLYVFRCTSCGDATSIGADSWKTIEEYGTCDQCLDREADEGNAAYDREHPEGSTLGPREAREDIVRCARCGKPTGRNILVKLCDACDHELDVAYNRWVEEQARVAYERSLLDAVQGAFWGRR